MIPRMLRSATAMILGSGVIVVLLVAVTGDLGAPVVAAVVLAVGVIVVLGGVVRLHRSPRQWGLGSAAWSASAAMVLASAFGLRAPFPASVVIAVGVGVALALTLVLIGASATRRDRCRPAAS